ncbi:MAG: hypothetical protein AB7F89_07675 [Pirellulaceae bacterium]
MRAAASILFLTLLVATGCQTDPGPVAEQEAVVPVAGTLTYQGEPLESFQVTFKPADGRRVATGTTDAMGKFTLGTNAPGDGAPPGQHKIAVNWLDPASATATGQEAIIDNPALLPKPSVKIPKKYHNPETSGLTLDVPADGLSDVKLNLE